jgi:prepilin-type processing-associated H-X9-DG protein
VCPDSEPSGPRRTPAAGRAAPRGPPVSPCSHPAWALDSSAAYARPLSIIATLAAILFPLLAEGREQARRATCLAHLRQLDAAERLYLEDWGQRFPYWSYPAPLPDSDGWYPWVAWPPRAGSAAASQFWTDSLQPYLHSLGVLHDPSPPGSDLALLGAPLAGYALYTWGSGGSGTPSKPYWRWAGPSLSLAQVQRPADLVILSDGSTTTLTVQADPGRHGGRLNACFLDGHARWLSRPEFLRVDSDGQDFTWLHYAAADR